MWSWLGKVWYYSLELDERVPLAGFSDDAVKAIFVRDPYTGECLSGLLGDSIGAFSESVRRDQGEDAFCTARSPDDDKVDLENGFG